MKSDNQISKFKKSENDISLSHRDEVKIINVALAQQSSRNIDIISKHLDPGVFDNSDFIAAIKQLSISSKFTKIRILINDSDPMIKNGHRLTELIQQLTSSIEVRKISEEYKSYNEAFCLYDGKGVIYLRYADRYDGFANFNRPRLATELSNFFNEVWEHSSPDSNLRRLHI
ncbi:MAG: acyltransferase [Gammaproteobacteria bacterium]|nr:acyltransferase [Gammaproteobacteria bacterium]